MRRTFLALLHAELATSMAYRSAYVMKLMTTLLYVWMPLHFWRSIYRDDAHFGGFTLESVCVYAVWSSVLFSVHTDQTYVFAQQVQDGRITIELTRPYGMLSRIGARFVAQKLNETLRALPLLALMTPLLPFSLFPDLAVASNFLFSVFLGMGIAFGIDTTIGFISILTLNVWGIRMLRYACMSLLSGATLPLSLLPYWLEKAAYYLPFQAIIGAPLTILTRPKGAYDVGAILQTQMVWFGITTLIAIVVWRILRPKLIIFGG